MVSLSTVCLDIGKNYMLAVKSNSNGFVMLKCEPLSFKDFQDKPLCNSKVFSNETNEERQPDINEEILLISRCSTTGK